jgi:hypothetical protein
VHGSNTRNLSVQLSLSQLAKTVCLCFVLCFLFNKIEKKRAEQVLPGSGGEGERWPTRYTHVSKCKNNLKKKTLQKILGITIKIRYLSIFKASYLPKQNNDSNKNHSISLKLINHFEHFNFSKHF